MPAIGLLRITPGGGVTFSAASTPTGSGANTSAASLPPLTSFLVTTPSTGIPLYDSLTQTSGNVVLALRNLVAGSNIKITNANGQLIISNSGGTVGTLGTQDADDVAISGGEISGVTITDLSEPVNPSDAATKSYVGSSSVNFSLPARPAGAQTIQVGITRNYQLVFGSGNPLTYCLNAAESSAVFTLQYVRAGVTTGIGTITFAASASAATLSSTATVNLLIGDILQLVTPTVQDVALEDVLITLVLLRE